jgi:hypothetical protein
VFKITGHWIWTVIANVIANVIATEQAGAIVKVVSRAGRAAPSVGWPRAVTLSLRLPAASS